MILNLIFCTEEKKILWLRTLSMVLASANQAAAYLAGKVDLPEDQKYIYFQSNPHSFVTLFYKLMEGCVISKLFKCL